jgi:hypothetical protein
MGEVSSVLKLAGAKRIGAMLYTDENCTAFSGEAITFDDIIGDTTAITTEDADVTTIDAETKSEPIKEIIELGSTTFAAESGDISYNFSQIIGWTKTTVGDKEVIAAPKSYKSVWGLVFVEFDEATAILPKLKLSGSVNAESLKTDMIRGKVSGTAYSQV